MLNKGSPSTFQPKKCLFILMKGKFIVIEGVDFTGKTTQSYLISHLLTTLGIENIITREPGGTPLGEKLRTIVLSDENKDNYSREAVILLFTAARAENIFKVIKPALESGKTVICDRFLSSTLAYQSALFNFQEKDILALHSNFNYNLFPDLTILLDAPTEILFERRKQFQSNQISSDIIKSRINNKYDYLPKEAVENIRQKFLESVDIKNLNTVIVQSKMTPEETFLEISPLIKKLF